MKIELVPCRIREDRIVPTGEDMLVVESAKALTKALSPVSPYEMQLVKAMRVGSFIGRVRSGRTGNPTIFTVWNEDRTNRIKRLAQDPEFPSRVLVVFRVDRVEWGPPMSEQVSA